MNRKLLATLLNKNIEELNMMTDSFIELNEYPLAIIQLAKRKTEDIQIILDELSKIKSDFVVAPKQDVQELKINQIPEETKLAEEFVDINKEEAQEEIIENVETVELEVVTEKLPEMEIIAKIEPEIEPELEPMIEPKSELEIEPISKDEDVSFEMSQTIEVSESVEEQESTVFPSEVSEAYDRLEKHEKTTIVEETKITTVADRVSHPTISRNEVMSKADNSISASIANKKITDIKQAISIGDRFRFQRELFKGNGEDMNKTLNYINQLATQEEIISFLRSKYKWDESNENTEDFYQIVRRKFL